MHAFEGVELPTAAEEIWRYSRIGELDLSRYTPGEAATTVTGPVPAPTAGDEGTWDQPDVFAALNAEHATPADTVVVRVPRRTLLREPIVVTRHVGAAGTAAFPRLVIDAGEDSEVTVVERFTSAPGADVLVVPVLQVRAAGAS